MANIKFSPDRVQSAPKYRFAKKRPGERFYEHSPHFEFKEEVTGDLVVSELNPFERRTVREALVTTETTDKWGRTNRPNDITTLSDDELLEALQAIQEGEPFSTPVRAYRRAEFATERGKSLPQVIEVPRFSITSLAGNLVALQNQKALLVTGMLQEPSGATEGLEAEQPFSRHVRDGLLASELATKVTAEITVEGDQVHQITEDNIRQGFLASINLIP